MIVTFGDMVKKFYDLTDNLHLSTNLFVETKDGPRRIKDLVTLKEDTNSLYIILDDSFENIKRKDF